jgi:pyruvate dehydrogenase E1 component beta subunit
LVPFDDTTILQSVKKTGRLVIVEEECKRGGAAGEIAAFVAEEGFEYLKAGIKRVASENVPMPYASVMENFVLPQVQDIVKAVEDVV